MVGLEKINKGDIDPRPSVRLNGRLFMMACMQDRGRLTFEVSMAIRLAFHQVSSLALLHIECVPSEIKEILFMHAKHQLKCQE